MDRVAKLVLETLPGIELPRLDGIFPTSTCELKEDNSSNRFSFVESVDGYF